MPKQELIGKIDGNFRLYYNVTNIAKRTAHTMSMQKALKLPREGWEADFKRCHALGEDALLIPDDLDDDLWNDL